MHDIFTKAQGGERKGVTYAKEAIDLRDRAIVIEQAGEPFRVIAGEELLHVSCE